MPRASRAPYENAPVGELEEPLLPRWFVVLAVVSVPVAIAVFVAAFLLTGSGEIPVAERRPAPEGALTHAVGEYALGDTDPRPWPRPCRLLDGVQVAGAASDLESLDAGLRAVCRLDLDPSTARAVQALATSGVTIRFAAFEATGVDSAVDTAAPSPLLLLNGRFTQTDPTWIAPLIVHDAVTLAGEPGSAETALVARQTEHAACSELFDDEPSRGCQDAAELLGLPDPRAALRAAGYR